MRPDTNRREKKQKVLKLLKIRYNLNHDSYNNNVSMRIDAAPSSYHDKNVITTSTTPTNNYNSMNNTNNNNSMNNTNNNSMNNTNNNSVNNINNINSVNNNNYSNSMNNNNYIDYMNNTNTTRTPKQNPKP